VLLSRVGSLVEKEWRQTVQVRPYLQLDKYVVMPNHFHAIVIFAGEKPHSKQAPADLKKAAPRLVAGSLGAVMAQFKSIVTKRSRAIGLRSLIWQANYYEHIIEDEESLARIRQYIDTNPLRWHLDRENQGKTGKDRERPV
jgi:REP element-mobilizing transposase RayT